MTQIRIKKPATKAAEPTAHLGTPIDGAMLACQQQSRTDIPAELLTVAEAAAYAKVCHFTIRRWIKAGKLPAYNSGRRVRVARDSLSNFLCNNG